MLLFEEPNKWRKRNLFLLKFKIFWYIMSHYVCIRTWEDFWISRWSVFSTLLFITSVHFCENTKSVLERLPPFTVLSQRKYLLKIGFDRRKNVYFHQTAKNSRSDSYIHMFIHAKNWRRTALNVIDRHSFVCLTLRFCGWEWKILIIN